MEEVVNDPALFRDGDAYFTGVWRQAETAVRAGLEEEAVRAALETLARDEVVREEDGRWVFTVELMRRWVVWRWGSDGAWGRERHARSNP